MANTFSEIDLTTCDDEPIHLLGKIQSNGCLLAFDKETFTLSFASSNAQSYFPTYKLSKDFHFRTIFDLDFLHFIQILIKKNFYNVLYPHFVLLNDERYRCFVSNAPKHFILEFEKYQPQESDYTLFSQFNQIIHTIGTINTLDVLYSTVVHEMKSYFGFDRVMMYKFDENGDGEIVAEEKEFGLDSFLGLRYPVTDIPKQARALYLTNLTRSINDVNDEGYRLYSFVSPASDNENSNELDLSYSIFRSVSPVHIQYLKNMGVTATHAISLVLHNRLWGMIIFHNYSGARFLDFNSRQIAQTMATVTANAIELLEVKERGVQTSIEKNIVDRIRFSDNNLSMFDVIVSNWKDIKTSFQASGLAFFEQNAVKFVYGNVPSAQEMLDVYNWIMLQNTSRILSTNHISKEIENWQNPEIGGFLSISIAKINNQFIVFWREVEEQIINWAGNPEKSMNVVEIDNRKVLTPRNSFALWQEKVKGKSAPWTKSNINFASNLSESLLTREIGKYGELLVKNSQLVENQDLLQSLLAQKTDELYRLSTHLQEELRENKKYQRELEIAKEASEQLNKMKSEFISNISHEVRTPINGIIGLAQLLQTDPENKEEVVELSHLILDSAKRLLSTVNRILNVSRLENNKIELVFETVDIIEHVNDILRPLQILANDRQLRIILNIHNKELHAITDKHYFGQIFTNLVSNAIKYTPAEGQIEINLKQISVDSKQMIFVSVEDNGIGIESALLDKIFQPFFTEAPAARQSDNSTGLGLYLVKNYLDYLNGKIEVNSTKGKGSTFSFLIPKNI